MQQCKFCGSTLPTFAHFCAHCGHVIDDFTQGTTYFSSPPKLDVQTPEAITPPLLNDPSHPFVSNSAKEQDNTYATISLQRFGEGNLLDDRHFEDRNTDENRAFLPDMILLATQMGEGQAPVGNVPMVQGTPQANGVPAVQGTPAMPVHPPGAQAIYHNAAASAPAAPPAPSWVPHTSPSENLPAHHPRHQVSGELHTHHHHRPHRRHIPRPHGIVQHLLIAAVVVIIIATSAVTGALAIFRPALSLSVNGGITPGGTFQLHGVNFTPGSSVTLTLDHDMPLSSTGHGDVGAASYGAGFANVLQMSVSAERSLQATAPGTTIPVSIQGTFDITIQVGQNWSAGVHTIHATDRVLGRTADLQFTIPPAQAKLVVTPSSVLDFGSLGTGRKAALSVIVGNMGGRQLHWTADVGSTPWLKVQPASGTLLPGNHEQVVNIVANASNLTAKDYSAVLHIASDAGEARIVVKLKVIPPGSSVKAILDVNPASLDFGTRAVGTQVTMNVTLANTGTQALNWGADTGNASWLKLSSSSGKILPGGLPQIINVTTDTTQLAAGNHSAILNITSNGGNKSVRVSLVVSTPIQLAQIAVSPNPLDFGAMDPGATKTLQETVKNTGGQALTWNLDTTSLPGWLSVDTSSGTVQLGSQQTINVTANTSNQSPGPYSATLNFTSNGGNASISVTLTVNLPLKPPLLCSSPNPLDFGALDPGGANKTLPETLCNKGGQPLTWNLDLKSLPGWLSVDTNSGTIQPGSSQTINVTADTAGLSAGPQSTTLTFTSNGGNASVSVTLTVNAPQVQRTLTSQQTQSQTVDATGQGTTQGTQAQGTLSFRNPYHGTPKGVDITLDAGTVFDDDSNRTPNVQMMIDATITVPGDGTSVTVSAHVVQIGTIGNISQIRGWTHYGANTDPAPVDIYNSTPLTGGTDPQTYTVVQQSDIDTAANSLKASTQQSAVADLNSQLRPNEHLVGNPQCTYNITSDHAAGEKATTVTVTVVATCTVTAST